MSQICISLYWLVFHNVMYIDNMYCSTTVGSCEADVTDGSHHRFGLASPAGLCLEWRFFRVMDARLESALFTHISINNNQFKYFLEEYSKECKCVVSRATSTTALQPNKMPYYITKGIPIFRNVSHQFLVVYPLLGNF